MKKFEQKDKIIINDIDEVKKYEENFQEQRDKFEEKVHGSMTEEMKRNIKTIHKAKINAPLEKVFNLFIDLAAKDMNPNLNGEDLVEGNFYITSKKMNKIPIKVSEIIDNETIEIEWFAEKHYFKRAVFFYGKANKTNIKMVDKSKAMETVFGLQNNLSRTLYLRRLKKSFKIQVLLLNLSIFDDTQINTHKLKTKLKKLQNKII